MTRRPVVAVLVLYSPAYAQRAADLFRRFVAQLTDCSLLVAITNSPELRGLRVSGYEVLTGDNAMQEFGAWQQALDWFRAEFPNIRPRYWILANDTFCHHRPFGVVEQLAFSRSFRAAMASPRPSLSGQYSTFHQRFVLEEVTLESWVCTYLFGLSPSLLERLNHRVCADAELLASYLTGGVDEDHFFSDALDPALKAHLVAWLFGRERLPRWYRAAPLSHANAAQMAAKARAILHEKLLTARSVRAGGEPRDVFARLDVRVLRKCLTATQAVVGPRPGATPV